MPTPSLSPHSSKGEITAAVVGSLTGVLIILVVVCIAVILCIYNQRRKAVASQTAAHGQTEVDDRLNPTYSPTAFGRVESELQPHSTPTASDSRGEGDENLPQYAVIGPTITTPSTANRSQQYEEVIFSPDRTPVLTDTNKPPPVLEHTYSEPECKRPNKKELPDPSYDHLLQAPQSEERKEARGAAADSSYSLLLHEPGGGHGVTQTGASEPTFTHPVYTTPPIGHADTDIMFANPTYSPTHFGHIASQHSTGKEADNCNGPQYAVLEGPTPRAPPSSLNPPPDNNLIDLSPYSIPVLMDTDQPPRNIGPSPSSSTGQEEKAGEKQRVADSSYSPLLHGPVGVRGMTHTGASEPTFSNPVYANPPLGHGETDIMFANPTYSPTHFGHIVSQHNTGNGPQYAVLEGPTPRAPPSSSSLSPDDDPIGSSPYSIPVLMDTDQPPRNVGQSPSSITGLEEAGEEQRKKAKVCVVS